MLATSEFRTRPVEKSSDDLQKRLLSEINGLTASELLKLQRFASWRIHALGHLAAGREHSDLLHEAIVSTLEGRRRWIPENLTFFAHLLGAMSSISNAWFRRGVTEARALPADGIERDQDSDSALAPFHNIPAREPSPERQAEARQTIRTIMDCFREDSTARKILTAMMEGETSTEIKRSMGITDIEYYTATKRIRRRLRKLFEPQSRQEKQETEAGVVP